MTSMPALIRFILLNLTVGAAIGAGVAMWLVAAQVGPGASVAAATDVNLAAGLLAYALGATFGLGYLATALAWADGT
jgi:hypothetical protein